MKLGRDKAKITMLCSLHQDNGLCNADELIKLLEEIRPDIIFGEVTKSAQYFYYPRSLEGRALARWMTLRACRPVRVDDYEMPTNFRELADSLFDYIENSSEEYQTLLEQRHHLIHFNGFTCLNSPAFAELIFFLRMSEIEKEAIRDAKIPDLTRALASWRQIMAGRDRAMVENIYRYCRENEFSQGVFLVGAAHRRGVGEAIQTVASSESDSIAWRHFI